MVLLRRRFALRDIGLLLLAVWLILTGLAGILAFALPGAVLAALALVAGILILIPR